MSVEAITEVIHEYMYEKLFGSPETEEEKRVRHVEKRKLFFFLLLSAPFSTVSKLQFLEQNEINPNFPSLLRKIFGRKPFFRNVFL